MSWEPVETFPGESRGGAGAFRGGAIPVVARRGAPTLRERVLLFWRSTPDLSYRRSAKRVALTPNHLYVERLDGDLTRVARHALRGRRVDRGRVVYGIVDGEDLAFLPREGCELVAALEAQLRGDAEPTDFIVKNDYRHVSLAFAFAAWAGAYLFSQQIHVARALRRLSRGGNYTSESALTLYTIAGLVLFGVCVLLAGPVRTRIDAVGVHRARGIFPWLHTVEAPVDFRRVEVLRSFVTKPARKLSNLTVRLLRHDGHLALVLERFSVTNSTPEAAERRADAYARRVGEVLGIEALSAQERVERGAR